MREGLHGWHGWRERGIYRFIHNLVIFEGVFASLLTDVAAHRAFTRHMAANQCGERVCERAVGVWGWGGCSQCGSNERVP